MGQAGVTLEELVQSQQLFLRRYMSDAGLSEDSPVVEGLVSGLDSLLVIMQVTMGPFPGLTEEAAAEIMDYFLEESYEHRDTNPEVSLWYLAWAATLENYFLP